MATKMAGDLADCSPSKTSQRVSREHKVLSAPNFERMLKDRFYLFRNISGKKESFVDLQPHMFTFVY